MSKPQQKKRRKIAAHTWKRAMGGSSCTKCGTFRARGLYYPPAGAAATRDIPPCKKITVSEQIAIDRQSDPRFQ